MDQESPSLHETILELCEGATHGAGAFAFATREGVDLLLRDDVFRMFARRGTFSLVVGVDGVTDVRALAVLQEASADLPGLTAKVFYHDLPRPVFHPKFCWFRHKRKGFLVTGSGNLTARGLRGNWEAFVVDELGVQEANALEAQWKRWVGLHGARLRHLDDGDVLARAALNVRRAMPGRPAPAREEEDLEAEEEPMIDLAPSHRVLIAEIPRAGGRWKQANFDLDTFREFFGVRPDTVRRVVFQPVDESGELGALESRPSVSVRSKNYRFELEAAAGLPYPVAGRPIAVFVEIAPRTYRYQLLMPTDPHYGTVDAFLGHEWTGRSDRMRRVRTTTDLLRPSWPDSPLWRMPLEIDG